MKASRELIDRVGAMVSEVETDTFPTVRDDYRAGNYPRADRTKDLNKRYRWDLWWYLTGHNPWLWGEVQGFDDAHIDTMLRRAVRPLGEVPA